jgi:hypothetical protein
LKNKRGCGINLNNHQLQRKPFLHLIQISVKMQK